MTPSPTAVAFLLLIGLELFFGLGFEEFFSQDGDARPGGIRTFPLLGLSGALLYLADGGRGIAVAAGALVLGGWLAIYYWRRLAPESTEAKGTPNAGLTVPVSNFLAYLLGPTALTQPPWATIGVTVAAVLILTGREPLHRLARVVPMGEIGTAGKFLILTGCIMPLLPAHPVVSFIDLTPRQVWLAVLAVCTISYASYLLQRYVMPGKATLATALLGGLYSSTATTVALARRVKSLPSTAADARTGIVLATSIMYLRLLVIVALFNLPLAQRLAPILVALGLVGALLALLLYRRAEAQRKPAADEPAKAPGNPLELTAAAIFAIAFVIISVADSWAKATFGASGVYVLAAIVGVTDIDPFVLSVAQGGATALPVDLAAASILIATASNNLLKAAYTVSFAGRSAGLPASVCLVLLSVLGVAATWLAV